VVKKHYKVVWQDEAKASLHKVYNFIKKQESKERAIRVISEIKKQGDSLGFIQIVRKTSSLQGLDIRTNLLIFDILFDNIKRRTSAGDKVAWRP